DRIRREIERRFVDIAEDRARVQARDHASGREERESARDDLVARLDPERHQRDEQRVRSGRHADRVASVRVFRNAPLELGDVRAQNEALTLTDLANRSLDIVAQRRILRAQIEQRDFDRSIPRHVRHPFNSKVAPLRHGHWIRTLACRPCRSSRFARWDAENGAHYRNSSQETAADTRDYPWLPTGSSPAVRPRKRNWQGAE